MRIFLLIPPLLLAAPSPALAVEWLFLKDPLNMEKNAPPSREQFSREQPQLHDIEEPCATAPDDGRALGVKELVNLALCNNPATRLSWLSALSQAYSLGSAHTAYIPEVSLSASKSRSASNPARAGTTYANSESVSISTSYTLFDFGRRERALEQALRGMIISNYSHDSALQGVILSTLQTYFGYVNARSALRSAQDSYASAEATYKAARIRYEVGLVPKGDILQAENAHLQSKIAVEEAERALVVSRGTLNERIGRPPNHPLEVKEEPALLNEALLNDSVDSMMEAAKKRRPDLITARLSVDNARTALKSEQLQDLPTVSVSASRNYSQFDTQDRSTGGSIGISMSVPIFSGFRRVYSLDQAKLSVQSSEESLRQTEQSAMLEIWQSYHDFQNARRRLETVNSSLEVATQAYDAALARYREGLGSILDTLSTLSALTSARTQVLSTQLSFYTSGLSLMRAIGVLDTRAALPRNVASVQ